MFLWAKLMLGCRNLSVLQPKKRFKVLMDLKIPETLNKVYKRIMKHIHTLDTTEQDLAAWNFTWLAYARRELRVEQLRESSRLVYTETEEEANDEVHLEQSVTVSFACLVKSDSFRKPATVRFIHI